MNKVQKGLIGTAVTATVVAAVGFGTYSAFNDSNDLGLDLIESEAATISAGIYDAEGSKIESGASSSFQLFRDRDDLHLLPGESWEPETFRIQNDGNRAFDIKNNPSGSQTNFDFVSSLFDGVDDWDYKHPDIKFENVEVEIALEFSEGSLNDDQIYTADFGDNGFKQTVTKGGSNQAFNLFGATLREGEYVDVSLSLGLNESADNEFQGQTFGAGFNLFVEQNNEADRN
ncbi:hypothetical protein [Alkalicoccus luteus]|uniref:Spore coat-associated protein N n=1 Tax=Alkalicoccus luteus TaxID=1237094 RepID=A0A969PRY1_9BACI|nr:hypothetical protein [Alkalicoccus luteus]NJP36873.1 hypothetical protein [Alkalicoccus luteus]